MILLIVVIAGLNAVLTTRGSFLYRWILLEVSLLLVLWGGGAFGEASITLMFYFIFQTIAAITFIFGGAWGLREVGLLLKLGGFPFNWWVVKIFRVTKKSEFLWVFIVIQKLMPVILLRVVAPSLLLLFRGALGLFQNSLWALRATGKSLFLVSSLVQVNWLISLGGVSSLLLISYFFIYFLLSSSLLYFLFIPRLFQNYKLFALLLFTVMGIPPLFGFILKAGALFFFIPTTGMIMLFLFLGGRFFTFFMYLSLLFKIVL